MSMLVCNGSPSWCERWQETSMNSTQTPTPRNRVSRGTI